jgi:hypothetical protein
MKVVKRLEAKTAKLRDVLSDRFAVFQQNTMAMWEDMNAENLASSNNWSKTIMPPSADCSVL